MATLTARAANLGATHRAPVQGPRLTAAVQAVRQWWAALEQRRIDRNVLAFLALNGGVLTDAIEREIGDVAVRGVGERGIFAGY